MEDKKSISQKSPGTAGAVTDPSEMEISDAAKQKLAELQQYRAVLENALELIAKDKLPEEIKRHKALLVQLLSALSSTGQNVTRSVQFLSRAEETLKKFKSRVDFYTSQSEEASGSSEQVVIPKNSRPIPVLESKRTPTRTPSNLTNPVIVSPPSPALHCQQTPVTAPFTTQVSVVPHKLPLQNQTFDPVSVEHRALVRTPLALTTPVSVPSPLPDVQSKPTPPTTLKTSASVLTPLPAPALQQNALSVPTVDLTSSPEQQESCEDTVDSSPLGVVVTARSPIPVIVLDSPESPVHFNENIVVTTPPPSKLTSQRPVSATKLPGPLKHPSPISTPPAQNNAFKNAVSTPQSPIKLRNKSPVSIPQSSIELCPKSTLAISVCTPQSPVKLRNNSPVSTCQSPVPLRPKSPLPASPPSVIAGQECLVAECELQRIAESVSSGELTMELVNSNDEFSSSSQLSFVSSIISKIKNESSPHSGTASPSDGDLMDIAVAGCSDAAALLIKSRKKLLEKVSFEHIAPEAPKIGCLGDKKSSVTDGRRYRRGRSRSRSSSSEIGRRSYSLSPRREFSNNRSPSPWEKRRRSCSPKDSYRPLSPRRRSKTPTDKDSIFRLKSPVYRPGSPINRSIFRRSRSPKNRRRSNSPKGRYRSKTPNERKWSKSPRRRSISPKRCTRSPRRRSRSPKARRRSKSPRGRYRSKTPNERKWSKSPRRRSISPKRCTRSPRRGYRSKTPSRRSKSPKGTQSNHSRHRHHKSCSRDRTSKSKSPGTKSDRRVRRITPETEVRPDKNPVSNDEKTHSVWKRLTGVAEHSNSNSPKTVSELPDAELQDLLKDSQFTHLKQMSLEEVRQWANGVLHNDLQLPFSSSERVVKIRDCDSPDVPPPPSIREKDETVVSDIVRQALQRNRLEINGSPHEGAAEQTSASNDLSDWEDDHDVAPLRFKIDNSSCTQNNAKDSEKLDDLTSMVFKIDNTAGPGEKKADIEVFENSTAGQVKDTLPNDKTPLIGENEKLTDGSAESTPNQFAQTNMLDKPEIQLLLSSSENNKKEPEKSLTSITFSSGSITKGTNAPSKDNEPKELKDKGKKSHTKSEAEKSIKDEMITKKESNRRQSNEKRDISIEKARHDKSSKAENVKEKKREQERSDKLDGVKASNKLKTVGSKPKKVEKDFASIDTKTELKVKRHEEDPQCKNRIQEKPNIIATDMKVNIKDGAKETRTGEGKSVLKSKRHVGDAVLKKSDNLVSSSNTCLKKLEVSSKVVDSSTAVKGSSVSKRDELRGCLSYGEYKKRKAELEKTDKPSVVKKRTEGLAEGRKPAKMSFQDLLKSGDKKNTDQKKTVVAAAIGSKSKSDGKTAPRLSFEDMLNSAEDFTKKVAPKKKKPISGLNKEIKADLNKSVANAKSVSAKPSDELKGPRYAFEKIITKDIGSGEKDEEVRDVGIVPGDETICDMILNMEADEPPVIYKRRSLLDLPFPRDSVDEHVKLTFLKSPTESIPFLPDASFSDICSNEPELSSCVTVPIHSPPYVEPLHHRAPLLPTPVTPPPIMTLPVPGIGFDPALAHRRKPSALPSLTDIPLTHRRQVSPGTGADLLYHRRTGGRARSTYIVPAPKIYEGPRTYLEHKELKQREAQLAVARRLEVMERKIIEEKEAQAREIERKKKEEETVKARAVALERAKVLDPRIRRKTIELEQSSLDEEEESESFTSPLVSLYGVVNAAQTGRGYGKQKFKIPKKDTHPVNNNESASSIGAHASRNEPLSHSGEKHVEQIFEDNLDHHDANVESMGGDSLNLESIADKSFVQSELLEDKIKTKDQASVSILDSEEDRKTPCESSASNSLRRSARRRILKVYDSDEELPKRQVAKSGNSKALAQASEDDAEESSSSVTSYATRRSIRANTKKQILDEESEVVGVNRKKYFGRKADCNKEIDYDSEVVDESVPPQVEDLGLSDAETSSSFETPKGRIRFQATEKIPLIDPVHLAKKKGKGRKAKKPTTKPIVADATDLETKLDNKMSDFLEKLMSKMQKCMPGIDVSALKECAASLVKDTEPSTSSSNLSSTKENSDELSSVNSVEPTVKSTEIHILLLYSTITERAEIEEPVEANAEVITKRSDLEVGDNSNADQATVCVEIQAVQMPQMEAVKEAVEATQPHVKPTMALPVTVSSLVSLEVQAVDVSKKISSPDVAKHIFQTEGSEQPDLIKLSITHGVEISKATISEVAEKPSDASKTIPALATSDITNHSLSPEGTKQILQTERPEHPGHIKLSKISDVETTKATVTEITNVVFEKPSDVEEKISGLPTSEEVILDKYERKKESVPTPIEAQVCESNGLVEDAKRLSADISGTFNNNSVVNPNEGQSVAVSQCDPAPNTIVVLRDETQTVDSESIDPTIAKTIEDSPSKTTEVNLSAENLKEPSKCVSAASGAEPETMSELERILRRQTNVLTEEKETIGSNADKDAEKTPSTGNEKCFNSNVTLSSEPPESPLCVDSSRIEETTTNAVNKNNLADTFIAENPGNTTNQTENPPTTIEPPIEAGKDKTPKQSRGEASEKSSHSEAEIKSVDSNDSTTASGMSAGISLLTELFKSNPNVLSEMLLMSLANVANSNINVLREAIAPVIQMATSGSNAEVIKSSSAVGMSVEKTDQLSETVPTSIEDEPVDGSDDSFEPVGQSDEVCKGSDTLSPNQSSKSLDDAEEEQTQSQEVSSSRSAREKRRTRRGIMRRMRLGLRKSKRLKPQQLPCKEVKSFETTTEDEGSAVDTVEESEMEGENEKRITRSSSHRIEPEIVPTPVVTKKPAKKQTQKSKREEKKQVENVEKKVVAKKKGELERLQEHLNNSFISNDLMNTSAQRSCRTEAPWARDADVAKRTAVRKKPIANAAPLLDEPSEVSLPSGKTSRREGSTDTTHSRDSFVQSKIQSKDSESSAEDNHDNSSGGESEGRGNSSVGRRFRDRPSVVSSRDSSMEDIKLQNRPFVNLNRVRGRNTARRGKPWRMSQGQRNELLPPMSPEPERRLRSQDRVASRDTLVDDDETLLNHAYSQTDLAVKCLLCTSSENITKMAEHYRTKHPESEVLISRLTKDEACRAIKESQEQGYTLDESSDAWTTPAKRVNNMICRLCCKSLNATFDEQLYLHTCGHTGEYRWKCGAYKCTVTTLTVDSIRSHVNWRHNAQRKALQNAAVELFQIPKTNGNIFGFVCTKCNYVQTQLKNVEAHVEKVHNGGSDIVKIDMFLKPSEDETARGSKTGTSFRTATNFGSNMVTTAPSLAIVKDEKRLSDTLVPDTALECKQTKMDNKRAVARKSTGGRTKPKQSQAVQVEENAGTPASQDPPHVENIPQVDDSIEAESPTQPRRRGRPSTGKTPDKSTTNRCGVAKKSTGGIRNRSRKIMRDGKQLEARMRDIYEKSRALKGKKRVGPSRVLTVGGLCVKWNPNDSLMFECRKEKCNFLANTMNFFERHVMLAHSQVAWNGYCDNCEKYPFEMSDALSLSMEFALEHIKCHLDPSWGTPSAKSAEPCPSTSTQLPSIVTPPRAASPTPTTTDLQPALLKPKQEPGVPVLEVPPMVKVKNEVTQLIESADPKDTEPPILERENFSQSINSDSEFQPTLEPQALPNVPLIRVRTFEGDKLSVPRPSSVPLNAPDLFEDSLYMSTSPPVEETEESTGDPLLINDGKEAASNQMRKESETLPASPAKSIPALVPMSPRSIIRPNTSTIVVNKTPTKPVVVYPTAKPLKYIAPKPSVKVLSEWTIATGEEERRMAAEAVEEERRKAAEEERRRARIAEETSIAATLEKAEAARAAKRTSELVSLGIVVKSNQSLLDMLTLAKLVDLFKCTSAYCSFTCNNPEIFRKHCNFHQDNERTKKENSNWRLCAYCNDTLPDAPGLATHIQNEHGTSEYQCAYCFYRAVTHFYVSLHSTRSHANSPVKVLRCPAITPAGPLSAPPSLPKCNDLQPYICDACEYCSIQQDEFLNHLLLHHSTSTAYTCHICKALSFRSKQLVEHYRSSHGFNRFHCGYCSKATDTHDELMSHLSMEHPTQKPCVFSRAQPEREDMSWKTIYKRSKVYSKTSKPAQQKVMVTPMLQGLASLEGSCDVNQKELLPNAQFSYSIEPEGVTVDKPTVDPVPVISKAQHSLPNIISKTYSKAVKKPSPTKTTVVMSSDGPAATVSPHKPVEVSECHASDYDSDIEIIAVQQKPLGSVRDEMADLRNRMHDVMEEDMFEKKVLSPSFGKLVDKLIVETLAGNETDGSKGSTPEKDDEPKLLSPIEEAIATLNKNLMAEKSRTWSIESGGVSDDGDDDDSNEESALVICEDADEPEVCPPPTKRARMCLDGLELYKCGAKLCPFNAETSADLSEHLMQCDVDRVLFCRSCNFRTISTAAYLRHLPRHGPKRYKCALCGLSSTQIAMHSHMKQKHKVNSYAITPEDPFKTDVETDYFVFRPNLLGKKTDTKTKPAKVAEDKKGSKEPKKSLRSASVTSPSTSTNPSPRRSEDRSRSPVIFHLRSKTPSVESSTSKPSASSAVQSSVKPIPPPKPKLSQPPRDEHTYGPEDEDKLPMHAVYAFQVKCAVCSYTNKVRSNMLRHLRLHKEGSVVVPTSAPTNPVPCLEGPRMFDKMTNLAASSLLERVPVDTLTDADKAKLPGFIPERVRYKCCANDCQYITLEKDMLHYHLSCLHKELSIYSCPHCSPTVLESIRCVPIASLADHLKYHDTKLYKCAHCSMCHYLRPKVEQHLSEVHSDRRQFVHVVREPEKEAEVAKAFKCQLCESYLCSTLKEMMKHMVKTHGGQGKFKCKECSFLSKTISGFSSHFAKCHGSRPVKYQKCYTCVNAPADKVYNRPELPSTSESPTAPLWQRSISGPRTIRGIPIDSESVETSKKRRKSQDESQEQYICKICHSFKTRNQVELKEHYRKELQYAMFSCNICSDQFFNEVSANKHANEIHPDTKHVLTREKDDQEIEYWMDRATGQQKSQKTSQDEKSHKKQKKSSTVSKPEKQAVVVPAAQPSTSATSSRRYSTANNSGLIHCPHCDFTDETLLTMKSHIVMDHLGLGKFMCNDCTLTFPTDVASIVHTQTEHGHSRVHQNPNADWYSINEVFWKINYGLMDPCQTTFRVSNYEAKAVTCDSCDIRTTPELMKFHAYEHLPSPDSLFLCDVGLCGFKTSSSTALADHSEQNHSWKEHLFRGIKIYDIDFPCHKCSFKSSFERKLLDHVEDEHSDVTERRWVLDSKFFICAYCRIRCSGPERVTAHLQTTHKGLALACRIVGTATLQTAQSTPLVESASENTDEELLVD